ncbi:MAG TPA: head GIN domain-containing protein [Sphingomicrobium sp.]|nr:head GIN domain-containing protein [Sphingomicrobium sp.]
MRIASIVAATAALAAAACGRTHAEDRGPTVDRNFQVGAFQSIEIGGPYEVEVRTGSAPSVRASGPEKLIERLVVEVEGDRLRIHPREERQFNWGGSRGTARIQVTVPTLRAAAIAGSGELMVDKIDGDRFEGSIAGSGDLRLETVSVQALKLSIGGSGSVHAGQGQARDAELSIAGSGDIQSGGVRTENARISIAGSGSVNGHASRAADVSIMGSGDVNLTGGAKCNVSKAGAGEVNCS